MEFFWFVFSVYVICLLGLAYKEGKMEAVRIVAWSGIQSGVFFFLLFSFLKVIL